MAALYTEIYHKVWENARGGDKVPSLDDMLWKNLRRITSENDKRFAKYVLESRSAFLDLRIRTESEIRKVYIQAVDNIAKQLKKVKPGTLTANRLAAMREALQREADRIAMQTEGIMRTAIERSFQIGADPQTQEFLAALREANVGLNAGLVQWGFAEVNKRAVEAFWARSRNGMVLSKRIWTNSQKARDAVRDVIADGIARGRSATAIARDLQKYVRDGAATLAKDYPNMMERIGHSIPSNLNYEALRVARTEMNSAFQEGSYAAGANNPTYEGSVWMLSASHPIEDICNEYAKMDNGGGPGFFPKGQEPMIPHPNCLCYTVPRVQDTKTTVAQLKRWAKKPSSESALNKWYNEFYTPLTGGQAVAAKAIEKAVENVGHQTAQAKYHGLEEMPSLDDIIAGKYKEEEGVHGDDVLYQLCSDQGFTGLPEVIDEKDLKQYIDAGEPELWRGIPEKKYIEQFKTGDYYAGRGMYGNGAYAAEGIDNPLSGKAIAQDYAFLLTKPINSIGPDEILHMTLKKEAKVITRKDLEEAWKKLRADLTTRMKAANANGDTKEEERLYKIIQVYGYDLGKVATALGYDAIFIPKASPKSNYWVILNRTALRVAK